MIGLIAFNRRSIVYIQRRIRMKKEYFAPEGALVSFVTEELLGPSDENPILDPNDGKSPNTPAEEFGDIGIF